MGNRRKVFALYALYAAALSVPLNVLVLVSLIKIPALDSVGRLLVLIAYGDYLAINFLAVVSFVLSFIFCFAIVLLISQLHLRKKIR